MCLGVTNKVEQDRKLKLGSNRQLFSITRNKQRKQSTGFCYINFKMRNSLCLVGLVDFWEKAITLPYFHLGCCSDDDENSTFITTVTSFFHDVLHLSCVLLSCLSLFRLSTSLRLFIFFQSRNRFISHRGSFSFLSSIRSYDSMIRSSSQCLLLQSPTCLSTTPLAYLICLLTFHALLFTRSSWRQWQSHTQQIIWTDLDHPSIPSHSPLPLPLFLFFPPHLLSFHLHCTPLFDPTYTQSSEPSTHPNLPIPPHRQDIFLHLL